MDRGRSISLAALSLAAFALPAAAQTTAPALTPDQRAERRMDGYFAHPTGIATFRALSGRGDPNADAVHAFERPAEERDLLVRMFPDTTAEDWRFTESPPWRWGVVTCRLDHGVETLREHIATLGAHHPYVEQWLRVQRVVYWPCLHPPLPSWAWRPPQQDGAPAGEAPTALPPPLQTSDAAIARLQAADRAYQSAAFAFYRGDIPAALARFQRVGADTSSPHRPTARYMIAAIHAGTRAAYPPEAQPMVPLEQATREIQAILADPSLHSVHPLAQELMGWVRWQHNEPITARAHVRNVLAALETPIEVLRRDPAAKARYDAALADAPLLVSHFDDPTWFLRDAPPEEGHPASQAIMDAARTDTLAAWLLMPQTPLRSSALMQGADGAAWAAYVTDETWAFAADPRADGARQRAELQDFAYAHWDRDGAAWRVAANGLSVGIDGGCHLDELTTRARAGDEQAAAELGFAFYDGVRWSLTHSSEDPNRPREGFLAALTCMRDFPYPYSGVARGAARDGLRYLMSVGRLAEARQWRDAFTRQLLAPDEVGQLLVLLAEDEDHLVAAMGEAPPPMYNYFYARDKVRLLNMLSIDALWRLAARADVGPAWRALFARVAWTRTYALGRVIDGSHDRLMRQLNPEITGSWTSPAGRAVRPQDRRVLMDVLNSPGLNILVTTHNRAPASDQNTVGLTAIDTFQHSDNNWWCRWEPERHDNVVERLLFENFLPDNGEAVDLGDTEGFALRAQLDAMIEASYVMRQQDRAEQAALAQIECAPRVLTARTMKWARRRSWFSSGDRQAEALALAVRTTRWGCQRDGGHGAYSRAAFVLLHQLFPDSDAARRTRYWYDCAHFSGGCPARD